jgi:transmembrane sensor
MSQANYPQFQVQDFLDDDYFIQWVINPDTGSNQFWQAFQQMHPHKQETISKAADIIKVYRAQDFFGNEERRDLLWQRVTGSVNSQAGTTSRSKVFSMRVLVRVAAAIIIIAGVALWMTNKPSVATHTLATAFGEVKTITLPDHSIVTLNGNSTLTYKSDWNGKGPREVWIKGEAYFNVQHLNKDTLHITPAQRFIVHCDDLSIEVLGTTFNVKNRRGKTNVALLTGKIRIDYADSAAGSKTMVMAPGDYVEYAAKKVLVAKKLVKPKQVTIWTSNEIAFTDATLREIAETLQDNYGYAVTIKDPELLSLKIEGDISVNDVTDLLEVVATTLNVTVEQLPDKHIAISK